MLEYKAGCEGALHLEGVQSKSATMTSNWPQASKEAFDDHTLCEEWRFAWAMHHIGPVSRAGLVGVEAQLLVQHDGEQDAEQEEEHRLGPQHRPHRRRESDAPRKVTDRPPGYAL